MAFMSSIVFALGLLFSVGACASAQPLPTESSLPPAQFGFAGGSLAGWKVTRLPRPSSAIVIDSPTRHGKHAAAVTLKFGETYGDSWKSELTDKLFAPFDQVIWYRVSHYLPGGFIPEKGNRCVLAQWHNIQPEDMIGGHPPLAHFIEDGIFRSAVGYYRDNTGLVTRDLYKLNLSRGVWNDFVYRVVWSLKDEGQIDAWYNGKYMGSYRGFLSYVTDVAGPYFKTGVYCEQSPVKPLTAYVDEYRRGPTADSILLPGEYIEPIR
jgi:hypothetical protein